MERPNRITGPGGLICRLTLAALSAGPALSGEPPASAAWAAAPGACPALLPAPARLLARGYAAPALTVAGAAIGVLLGAAAWASFTRRRRAGADLAPLPPVSPPISPFWSRLGTLSAPALPANEPALPAGRGADAGLPAPRDRFPFAAAPVSRVIATLHQWLQDYRDQADLWSSFDQVVRETLAENFQATRIRLYHFDHGTSRLRAMAAATRADELTDGVAPPSNPWGSALGEADKALPPGMAGPLGNAAGNATHAHAEYPARVPPQRTPPESGSTPGHAAGETILDHVALTGREFYVHDLAHSPMLRDLAARSAVNWTWIWPVRDGRASIGILAVGGMGDQPLAGEIRQMLGHALTLCWQCVSGCEQLRRARCTDRGSGVLTRADFFTTAARALAEAYGGNEPVVVAVIALEGLRRVDDKGWWRARDQAVERLGETILKRLRSDDYVGRFADDRFVLLLRRLDVGLGRLIVEKLLSAIEESLADMVWQRAAPGSAETPEAGPSGPVPSPLRVRVGLAGSGFAKLPLEQMLATAMDAVDRARREGVPINAGPPPDGDPERTSE